jgi:hypothetical protein
MKNGPILPSLCFPREHNYLTVLVPALLRYGHGTQGDLLAPGFSRAWPVAEKERELVSPTSQVFRPVSQQVPVVQRFGS